jgi:hypothetical protein
MPLQVSSLLLDTFCPPRQPYVSAILTSNSNLPCCLLVLLLFSTQKGLRHLVVLTRCRINKKLF